MLQELLSQFEKAVKNRNIQEYIKIEDKQTNRELLMKQNKFFRCFESGEISSNS